MHTSKTIFTADFEIKIDGDTAAFDHVLHDFTVNDRVAVVTSSPGGAFAAAPLLLAAIGRYYELLRARGDDFYRYPGYYVIHVGGRHGYHGWIDIWPANKEVVVPAHAEAVLEALHDRAVTRVILQDAGSEPGELMREYARWWLEDVRDVLTYTPGHSHGPITFRPPAIAAELIERAAQASHGVVAASHIEQLIVQSHLTQGYTRISTADALRRICAFGPNPAVLGQDAEYLHRHGADEAVMQPHRYVVR